MKSVMKNATGNSTIKCEICGKEFKNKKALRSHMYYVH